MSTGNGREPDLIDNEDDSGIIIKARGYDFEDSPNLEKGRNRSKSAPAIHLNKTEIPKVEKEDVFYKTAGLSNEDDTKNRPEGMFKSATIPEIKVTKPSQSDWIDSDVTDSRHHKGKGEEEDVFRRQRTDSIDSATGYINPNYI